MPKCSHCKTEFKNKSEFRIKGMNKYSAYCTMCRDIAHNIKGSYDDNMKRDLNKHELKLMKRFVKKLSAKERKEKLPITGGVV